MHWRHWHRLFLPRALSSFVVDNGTEVHLGDATVAQHPATRALRLTRGISISSVRCVSSGNGISMRQRMRYTPQTLRVGVAAMPQAIASTQTARTAGRRADCAETPVAVVFRIGDTYLAGR